jgi:hypothetical protein
MLLVAVANAEEAVLPPAVKLTDVAGIELDPVPRGSSVELVEGVGNAADTLAVADVVGMNSEAVTLALVPDQSVMLVVGIGISPEPPVDLSLEKDPARSSSEILPVVLVDGTEVAFVEIGGTVMEGGEVLKNEVTLLGLDGVKITEGCCGYPGRSETLDTPVAGKAVELTA